MPSQTPDTGKIRFNDYQKFAIAILAFLQFTVILDFMILSPWAPSSCGTWGWAPRSLAWWCPHTPSVRGFLDC